MSEWQRGTIGELAKGYRGVTYSAGQLREFKAHDTVTLLRSNNISGGQLNFGDVQIVSERLVSDDQFLTPGDIAVCMSNGSKALVGKSAQLVADSNERFTVGAFCSVFRPQPSVNSRFVAYVFQSSSYRSNLDLALAGTAINNLRNVDVEAFACGIPPYEEQSKIAQILDTLDTSIRETEALIDKLKAVKQGLLHDLLTRGIDANGQLRPPQSEAPQLYKESPLGWIPKEWEVVKLGAVLSELGQGWSPDCPSEPAGVGEWGVLKTTSVVWGGYNEDENKQLPVPFKPRPDLEVKSDDILITRAGPKSRVGVVVHVPSTRPQLMISDKIYRLRLLSSEVPAYFALALSAGYMQSAISRTVSGMAESQTNISQGVIKGLAILRPIREEQHAIVAHARAFDERLRAEALSLSKLQAQKNGLMDDLLTGRVRVTPLLESVQQAAAQTGA